MAKPEYPASRFEEARHWIIYTNAGYFFVQCTEDDIWTKQQEYVAKKRAEGARLDQIVFTYMPVKKTLIGGVY